MTLPSKDPNVFFKPAWSRTALNGSSTRAVTTVFFVSGNPGLVAYYHPFLSLLSLSLDDSFQVYACSLSGFEVDYEPGTSGKGGNRSDDCAATAAYVDGAASSAPSPTSQLLLDLECQISYVEDRLHELMRRSQDTSSADDSSPEESKHRVILIGHSVGAYIAMEILRRHRERQVSRAKETDSCNDGASCFRIVGGVMLFPTVVDIAKSPSGQRLKWLLLLIPRLALVVSLLARLLTSLVPTRVLKVLIKGVLGSPSSQMVETTLAFLKSKNGVRQAIHMGADEMRTITADKWSDDIWGIATGQEEEPPRMAFYFGRNDHWVAEKTRKAVIKIRGRQQQSNVLSTHQQPTMVVCENGLPHAFCLQPEHSDIIARKTAGLIRESVLRE